MAYKNTTRKIYNIEKNKLYYRKETCALEYNNKGQGTISIPKLVEGKPCFRKPIPANTWEKKTIILTDWTAEQWSSLKRRKVQQFISDKLEEGFSIYAWQQNHLKKLKVSLHPDQVKKITPVTNKVVFDKAQALNISKEHLYILDDYEIEQLFEKKKERTIKSDVYQNTTQDKQQLHKVLKELPLKSVEYNAFPNNPYIASNLSNILQLPLTEHIEKLILDDSQLHELIKNQKVSINNKTLNESVLNQIEQIEYTDHLKAKISQNQLTEFLKKNKNLIHLKTNLLSKLDSLIQHNNLLRTLEISPLKTEDKNADNEPILWGQPMEQRWETLVLNLGKKNIDSQSLGNLLKNPTQLLHFDLTHCNCIGNLPPLTLPSLKWLKIEDCTISIENLNQFLTPNLHHILLSDTHFTGTIASINRPYLEFLYLKGKAFSSKNISNLIQNSPKLKFLSLLDSTLSEPINVTPLSSLLSFECDNCSITNQNLENLLKNAPNLTQFRLSGQPIIELMNWPFLHSLTHLNLAKCTLSSQNLELLLQKTPNLTKINLEEVTITGSLNSASLPLLTSLKLFDCKISATNLNALVKESPNLSDLTINQTELNEALPPLSLPSLKYFKLSKCKLAASNLSTFLKATSNLRTLNLKEITMKEHFTSPSLNSLENFYANHCEISEQSLQSLIQNSPKLDRLDLLGRKLKLTKPLLFPSTIGVLCSSFKGIEDNTCDLSALKNLRILYTEKEINSFNSLDHIPAQKFSEALNKTPNLELLTLMGNLEGTLNIIKPLSHLQDMALIGRLSSQNLCHLLRHTKNLKSLNISLCQSDQFIKDVIYLPLLEELTLGNIGGSGSNYNLAAFLAGAPNLKTLDLTLCSHLNFQNLPPEIQKLLNNIPEVLYPTNNKLGQEELPLPINHPHNEKESFSFKPTPADFQFTYKNSNKARNQSKIIEQLSQYLTLTQRHLDWIPKIQDGICQSLAYFCANKKPAQWENWLNQVTKWDGTDASSIKNCFEELLPFVNKYQINSSGKPFFLGDALFSFLETLPNQEPMVITNYRHALSIKRLDKNNWYFYDPEDVEGGKKVTSQKLKELIHYSLGSLVGVKKELKLAPKIKNAEQFIEQGGLLALCTFSNSEAMLQAVPIDKNGISLWPEKVFEGLFVRDNQGEPAWHKAKRLGIPKAQELTTLLLEEFQKRNPDNYQTLLDLSIQDMVLPKENKDKSSTDLPQPSSIINESNYKDDNTSYSHLVALYKKRLTIWEKSKPSYADIKVYCLKKVDASLCKKKLIEVSSETELQALQSALLSHAKNTSRPIFCINSPEDLICAVPYMRMSAPNTPEGYLAKGPGGPLYQFLQENKDKNPILLVNYSAFEPQDLVRFNTLLDSQPKVDGIDLPKSALIIGLMDTSSSHCYQGADFYSRFNEVELSTLNPDWLAPFTPELPPIAPETTDGVIRINLFHASDWKERLVGRWILQGQKLFFEEGALVAALKSQKPLVIENGLWNNPEFNQFWQQILISQTVMQPQGAPPISCSKKPTLYRAEGYNWEALITHTHWDNTIAPKAQALNSNQLSNLFYRYECVDDSLVTLPGILESSPPNKPLHLNLTHALSEDEWAQCLTKAREFNIPLHIHCAPGISLPEAFSSKITLQKTPLDSAPSPDEEWISTDIDSTVAKLIEVEKPDLVLDISECDASDLLIKIKGDLSSDLSFKFTQSECILQRALREGKTVILKGAFSEELANDLAPLLLARKDNQAIGRLLLVHEHSKIASYIPQKSHEVSIEEKCSYLKSINPQASQILEKELLAGESLAQLKARLYSLQRHPEKESNKAWEGLYDLPLLTSLAPLDLTQSDSLAQTFTQNRIEAVEQVLKQHSFVFLTGLTAVGKTTFVRKYLSNEAKLYEGESNLKAWAEDPSSQKKILFLDEANLSSKQWSEMEGLLGKPKRILVDGQFIPLNANHQVVFAGNPVTYGDDRKVASFFARNGNTVLFEPLPLASVYEDILKPVFVNTSLESQTAELCKPILNLYAFLYPFCQKEILISPRELQMMALLTSSYCKQFPEISPQKVAEYYTYQLGSLLVPKQHQGVFSAQFNLPERLERAALPPLQRFFTLTPSRLPCKNILDDLLHLRQFRRDSSNEIAQYGGLGGIIFQGDPGVGKSELVIHTLIQHGYQELHISGEEEPPERSFYRIPASMSLEEKKALLLKAFHEGSIVVIDEINSSLMMEQLLNSLLMGRTLEGEKPKKTGFMVIGTQNPASMGGRIDPSTALARRLLMVEVPPYPAEELQALLIHKGLDALRAEALVTAFNQQVNHAKKHHLSPVPCFRDLINVTDEILTGTFRTTLAQYAKQVGPSPKKPNYSFLYKTLAVISATLSLAALIVTALALTSIISLSTAGIGIVIGVGIVSAALALGLFKAGNKENKSGLEKPQEEKVNTPS